MSKVSKLSFLFSGLSFICLILGRLALGGWHSMLWIPLILFLILFVLPFVKDGAQFVSFLRMKTTKQGMSMGVMILMVLSALTITNMISVRHYKTWDFSAAQTNTLSEQSLSLLKSLDADLKVTFFYKIGQEGMEENRRLFRELIKKYQDQSDRVRLDFVEVNERPDLATEYGVNKGSGLVFLEYKGRRNRIEKIDEQELTSALLKVTREKEKTLYFTTGHGEVDLEEMREASGGNALKMMVTNNRYKAEILPLNVKPLVPADADAVVVVGPTQNFLDHELNALEEYLKHGGSLVLALEPKKTGGLEKLLAKVGVTPQNNYVFNVVETVMGKGLNQGPTMGSVFSTTSPITKVFGHNQVVLMQAPMALKTAAPPPSGIALDEIVKSPEASMAFKDMNITGEGPTGSYAFGVTATGRWPGADDKAQNFLLAVYGDSEFLTNALLYQNLNRDLALNTFATLVHEENTVSIAPREAGITPMKMTEWNFRLFLWAFAIPLPFLLAAVAIGLGLRRRAA